MYRYFADAGQFTECLTRRKWPVAQEKDNAALESAYAKARLTPGEELLVNLEGQIAMRPKMEGKGAQPTLVVEHFIGIWPGETCGARFSTAPLENTYWKLTRLRGAPVSVAAKQRESHFVLDSKTKRIAGSGGCNRFTGTYERGGERLTLGNLAMTFMACPEGMETEQDFIGVLEQVVENFGKPSRTHRRQRQPPCAFGSRRVQVSLRLYDNHRAKHMFSKQVFKIYHWRPQVKIDEAA